MQNQKKLLIKELIKMGIKDQKILKAIACIPRETFISQELKAFAYKNAPLAIGCGQTVSKPYMVALMSELLELEPSMKVLEIGTGSGYQAAVLDFLSAKVHSIERISNLYEKTSLFLRQNYPNIRTYFQDGNIGLEEEQYFDRIIITAACKKYPNDLIKQLNKENGIIVFPIDKTDEIQKLVKLKYINKIPEEQESVYCRFMPLLEGVEKT